MTGVLDLLLAGLTVGLALVAVMVKSSFRAVSAFVGLGLWLALCWVRLGADDVALTEAAVGGGVTGLILIRAGARLDRAPPGPVTRPLQVLAALVAVLFAAGLAACVLLLPDPAPSLAPEVARLLPDSGFGNPVTAVLMVYRPMDTLLETVVLLLALVGIWSLSSDAAFGGAPAPLWDTPPRGASVFLARLLPPLGLVIGLHIFWTGADHPGGKFQGGALLAAMWLLALLAGRVREPVTASRWVRISVLAGPLVFTLMGLAGLGWAGAFLAYPVAWTKPLVLAVEFASVLSVAASLALMVLGPARLRPQSPASTGQSRGDDAWGERYP